MNDQDYNAPTLAWGVGIALVTVLIATIIVNAPEMIEIITSEGLLS